MDYEALLTNHIGEFGIFQQLAWFGLGQVFFTINAYFPTFIHFIPKYRCMTSYEELLSSHYDLKYNDNFALSAMENMTNQHMRCSYYNVLENSTCSNCAHIERCHRSIYDASQFNFTFVKDFDLGPCSAYDPSWVLGPTLSKISFIEAVFWTGVTFGPMVFGIIGDNWGGKLSLNLATLSVILSMVFILGLASIGAHSPALVYFTENVGSSYKNLLPVAISFRAFGGMTLALAAYWLQDWRLLWVFCAFINALSLPIWWLLKVGRHDEARIALKFVAKINGCVLEDGQLDEIVKTFDNQASQKTMKDSIWRALLSPVAFVHLIVMNLVFFSSSTTFYGVIRLSVELPGSMYANFALESFFELFSTLYTALALNFLGRKFFTMFGFFVAGIALPMAASVQHHLHKVSLCILARFLIGSVNIVLPLYLNELQPTHVRNTASGICLTLNRIGMLTAASLITSQIISSDGIMLYFGVLNIATALVISILLPETKYSNMPETVEDAVKLRRKGIMPITKWIMNRLGQGKSLEKQSLLTHQDPMAK